MRARALAIALAAGAVVWLAGCAVGPDYRRPRVDSPPVFRGELSATNRSFADLAWWEIYPDPALQALIREAFTNNYDLRIALARVEQSRALAMQARSAFFPNVNYNGAASQGRNYLFAGVFPNNGATAGSAVAAVNAFWELDLWGRVRRLNEAARAELLASEDARRAVRLSLLGDVASDYFRLLELDQELEIAARTTNSFGSSLHIFSQRMAGGTASALETSRADAALQDAEAALPSIFEQIDTTENELCILLGRVPGPIPRVSANFDSLMPPSIPAGLPSALLERRPDVVEAEHTLHASTAEIGESVAEFFPTIGLTGLLGKVSPQLSALTGGTASAWGVAAEATGPLFEGGRLVGQYRQRKAARDEALLRYRQIALTALRDVSDALTERDHLGEIREHQAREVRSLETAVKVSTERYRAGKASYYEVLEAQQQLFPAELNLARTKRDQLLAIVALYKALGGGWENENKAVPRTRPAAKK